MKMSTVNDDVEVIDIIPDVCAYAERQPCDYNVIELLRKSEAIGSAYIQVIDFRRAERAEVLGYVRCDPFQHTLPDGSVIEYSVLIFRGSAVCVIVHNSRESHRPIAHWCNSRYQNTVVDELLRYKIEQSPHVLTFGRYLSHEYAASFILYKDRPWVREMPKDDLRIDSALLVRCDNRVVPTESISIECSTVTIKGFDLKDDYDVTMDLDEFSDQYKVYRECVNKHELPFHISETHWR